MKAVHEDLIRQRAYEIWESQGRPLGFDRQHWEQAERELLDASPEIEERTAAQPAAGQDGVTETAQRRPEQGTMARPADRQPVREAPRVR